MMTAPLAISIFPQGYAQCALLAASLIAGGPIHAPSLHRPTEPVVYRIDVSHSRLIFKIRHIVSKVEGRFDRWSGAIVTEPDNFSKGSVEVNIETASINTNNISRDTDLRSANFFLADSFPMISFKSSRVEVKGSALKVFGTLSIRGITKPVVLEGEFLGRQGSGPGERIGFEATTKINRLDYGVSWNRALEGGGALLGDEVTIELTVAATRPRGS